MSSQRPRSLPPVGRLRCSAGGLLSLALSSGLALGMGCNNGSEPETPALGPSPVAAAGSGSGAGASGAPGTAGATSGVGGARAMEGSQAGGSVPLAGSSSTMAGGTLGPDGSEPGAGVGPDASAPPTLHIPWDWAGIVGTGQSLAVGDPGSARNTVPGSPRLTTQPFQNTKLSLADFTWPVDANDPRLTLIPLVEPLRPNPNMYPSSWPRNISGETAHAAMGNQITSLVKAAGGADYVNVHGEVGENGQCLNFLIKNAVPQGLNGRAFEATLIETRAITRLARAEGKTYGVGAIIVTHGECDQGNPEYEQQLHQLWADYNTDVRAITGQTEPLLMIVSQQNAVNDRALSTRAQWRIGVDFPNDVVCSGPKYQYPYSPDSIHMVVDGYEQLGEKYAQVYYERVVLGHDWQPLQPTGVERTGARVLSVAFHVPVPPLAWEESFQAPHQNTATEWRLGKGFEVRAGNTNLTIASVEIADDVVRITTSTDLPATNLTVGYAVTGETAPMSTPHAGTMRWGQLRDSDPFIGSSTQKAQPNFAVAFELPVP